MSDATDDIDTMSEMGESETGTANLSRQLLPVLLWIQDIVVLCIKDTLLPGGLPVQSPTNQHSPGSSGQEPGSSASSPSETPAQAPRSALANNQQSRSNPRKHKLDDNDGNGGGETNPTLKFSAKTPIVTFACPFHKRYPDNGHMDKICGERGWENVHRLK